MDWKNKTVLITGASTGIGQATLQLLHQKGCSVYNLDIVPPVSNEGKYLACDMRDRIAIRDAVKSIAEKEGKIDMLFANAGVHLFAGIEETSDDQLDNIIGINIFGVWTVLQAVLPVMKQQNRGAVVLMGSDQSFIGKASSAAYGMTKGAIGQLTKSTAIDYAKYNIRVNCICPGTIDTPLLEKAVDRFVAISSQPREKVMADLQTVQPAGRIGTPLEIANAVAFLLSDESSFVTGSLLSADGGYVCQ
jgi:NAD(P)-dependent dehydrogenase (short-subunit alcohol dehydrogenase family)